MTEHSMGPNPCNVRFRLNLLAYAALGIFPIIARNEQVSDLIRGFRAMRITH